MRKILSRFLSFVLSGAPVVHVSIILNSFFLSLFLITCIDDLGVRRITKCCVTQFRVFQLTNKQLYTYYIIYVQRRRRAIV